MSFISLLTAEVKIYHFNTMKNRPIRLYSELDSIIFSTVSVEKQTVIPYNTILDSSPTDTRVVHAE